MNTDLLLKRATVFLYDFMRERTLRKKVRRILLSCYKKEPPPLTLSSIENEHKALWKVLSNNVDMSWLKMYGSISGIRDPRYVPENIYYNRIEPCLNNKAFSKGYNDKNFYPLYLGDFKIPSTLISNIEGIYYNSEHKQVRPEEAVKCLDNERRFIIKPAVDSGGGKKVTLWEKSNDVFLSNEGKVLSLDSLHSIYDKNFIIQRIIEQHSFFSRFNPTSVNTVKVFTYRSIKDEKINILNYVLRVGASGKITDNQASGGYACGITDGGQLTGLAVDKMGNMYKIVNDTDLVPGTKVEGFEKILQTSRDLASRYYYARLLGLDLCLDRDGDVIVLEVNNVNHEINFFQMLYGPLFKEFTDEIISYCLSHRRSFMIDFEI